MKISDEFLNELKSLKNNNDFEEIYDDIIETMDNFCNDDFTRGYLTRHLEVESNSLYGKSLFEEFYYFAKRIKENND